MQKKCTVIVDHELFKQLQNIKKCEYYDKPYTQLYRDLFKLGLEKLAKQAGK